MRKRFIPQGPGSWAARWIADDDPDPPDSIEEADLPTAQDAADESRANAPSRRQAPAGHKAVLVDGTWVLIDKKTGQPVPWPT